jgi:hypothetical protein
MSDRRQRRLPFENGRKGWKRVNACGFDYKAPLYKDNQIKDLSLYRMETLWGDNVIRTVAT